MNDQSFRERIQPLLARLRWFAYGAAFGAALIGALFLQWEYDYVGKVDYALGVFSDGCDTSICCETCDTLPVSRIIDGDTFVSGFRRVRLFGVDTPEIGERCAGAATQRLRDLAGDVVRVERGPRPIDPFGRQLYYVYTKDGESIDERLIREGLGYAWTRDGQHRDNLMNLERKARSRHTGCLW